MGCIAVILSGVGRRCKRKRKGNEGVMKAHTVYLVILAIVGFPVRG